MDNDRWLTNLSLEIKLWLNQKLMEGSQSLEELLVALKDKFPQFKFKTSVENLRWFAQREVPNWIEPLSLEEKVKQQVGQVKSSAPEEFLSKEEVEKINALSKHRMVLSELWKNYKISLGTGGTDTGRARFLELISKELILIEQIQTQEKGLQSMLSEIKKCESEETVQQFRDFLEGYTLPLLIRKSKETGLQELDLLKSRVELMEKILKSNPDIEECIKDYLQQLYA